MVSQPAVQWIEIEHILRAQPGPQVPFDQYILNLGPLQGSVISLAPPGQQAVDQLRPRAHPRRVLPRQVPDFVGRGSEQREIAAALARGQVVELHGAAGTGKTSLLSQTMHLQPPGAYPAGTVYLALRGETAEDVLQELVDHFYAAGQHRVKLTGNEVRRLMAGKQALIVLDDADGLAPAEAEAIAQALPQAALVVAGREPQVRQGQPVALGGLAQEEAVALFERHLGRPLRGERPEAEAICQALGNVPLPVVQAARVAGLRQVQLAQVLLEVQARGPGVRPVEQLLSMLGRHLSAGERQMLAIVAAPGGSSVSHAALAHISALAPARLAEVLLSLEKLGLLHVEGDRYSLQDALRSYLWRHAVSGELRARAAAYYQQQARALRVHFRHSDEENVLAALEYYRDQRQWRAVLGIVQDLEAYLVTSGHWGQWRRRLEDAWHAGRELGDPRTEAWAQSQLGIVNLAAGDRRRAAQLFRAALRIWRAIGDQAGEAIARWNLQIVLGQPAAAVEKSVPMPAAPHRAIAVLRAIIAGLAAIAATLLILLGALLWVQESRMVAPVVPVAAPGTASAPASDGDVLSGREVSPIPTVTAERSATPSGSPAAAAAPVAVSAARALSPTLEIWLVEGCDSLYAPGESVEVRARSEAAGLLDIYALDGSGQRHRLWRVEVRAGQTSHGRYTIRDGEGSWLLVAELDGGQATAACPFAVADPESTPIVP